VTESPREPKPRVAVVTFPGSNDDGDAVLALTALGAEPVPVWHAERELPDVQAVVLPGGFSYGDYLRAGALARLAPVMEPVRTLVADGGLVLGICNGFQILCEAGLLPGALRANQSLSFVCRDVEVGVERADTPFTRRCREGQRLSIPVKHGEGCFFADAELLAELEASSRVVLRYEGESPNGSVAGIAGIANEAGNVMGLMPHPEHAVDRLAGSTDGAFILGSLIDAARESLGEPAAV
jgi:phosphoribosylformylglycinamidine synthase subunit PurQ / glutaminase